MCVQSTMFIPTPKMTASMKGPTKLKVVPLIPLERLEHKKAPKASYITFKLCSKPTDKNFPKYDFSMQYFCSSTSEELFTCLKNIGEVFVGMNTTTGPNQYTMVCQILQGDPLSAFEVAAVKNGNETVKNHKKYFTGLKKHVFIRKLR